MWCLWRFYVNVWIDFLCFDVFVLILCSFDVFVLIDVVIIGMGFVGLGMVIQFKQNGIDNFFVFEKVGFVGGMWCDNYYFGCVCDV